MWLRLLGKMGYSGFFNYSFFLSLFIGMGDFKGKLYFVRRWFVRLEVFLRDGVGFSVIFKVGCWQEVIQRDRKFYFFICVQGIRGVSGRVRGFFQLSCQKRRIVLEVGVGVFYQVRCCFLEYLFWVYTVKIVFFRTFCIGRRFCSRKYIDILVFGIFFFWFGLVFMYKYFRLKKYVQGCVCLFFLGF